MPPTVIAKRKCFQALITNCVLVFVSVRQRLCYPLLSTRAYFMLFYKFVASKNFPPKSLMPRVTSNLLVIKRPTDLFPQHGTSPENIFVTSRSVIPVVYIKTTID